MLMSTKVFRDVCTKSSLCPRNPSADGKLSGKDTGGFFCTSCSVFGSFSSDPGQDSVEGESFDSGFSAFDCSPFVYCDCTKVEKS